MDETNPTATMVCFVTEQNVTNILPALLEGINQMILIYTFTANERNWDKGLTGKNDLLANKGIHLVKRIELRGKYSTDWLTADSIEQDPIGVSNLIYDSLRKFDTCVFNFGGGNKIHSLAMTLTYQKRYTDGKKNDEIIYLDTSSYPASISKIKYDESGTLGKADGYPLNEKWTNNDLLTIQDFEKLFGWTLIQDKETTRKDNLLKSQVDYQILNDLDFRRFYNYFLNKTIDNDIFADLKSFKNFVNNNKGTIKEQFASRLTKSGVEKKGLKPATKEILLNTLINILTSFKVEIEKEIAINSTSKVYEILQTDKAQLNDATYAKLLNVDEQAAKNFAPGKLLEFFVMDCITALTENVAGVADSRQNYTVRADGKTDNQEFDVLLLTKNAQLIHLDVKSGNIEKQKYESSKAKLQKIGGHFVRNILVFPLFLEDCDADYHKEFKRYEIIADVLDESGYDFCICTNRPPESDKNFFIGYNNSGKESTILMQEPAKGMYDKVITCKTLTYLLQTELNLI